MRFAALVSVLLLTLTAPALAQDGTWNTTGTHSTRGAFTGTVTDTKSSAGWAQFYTVEGSYVFEGDGKAFTWSGSAWGNPGQVYLWNHFDTPGIVGRLEGRGGLQRGYGSYTLTEDADGKKTLEGGWKSSGRGAGGFEVTETLTVSTGEDPGEGDDSDGSDDGDEDVSIAVDLILVAADGSEVADADEETKGMVVSTNVDDDGDGGEGGHAQNVLVSDKDDTDGVSGEDDLIQVKLAQPEDAPEGSSFRLTFGDRIAVWRGADKTERVVSGETKLDPTSTTLYVEGLAPTKAGAADMPAKRWSALFLNSCYSGQYYSDSFGGQGTLFFTHESASASRTSGQFILGTTDGKPNDEILETMNQAENVHDYVVNQ